MALKRSSDAAELHQVSERDYPRDFTGLVAQLQDPDTSVRRWAARDLANHPEAAAALCARLPLEADRSVRSVLFSSATRLGGVVVVKAMIDLLRSEDAGLRTGAIEVLSSLPEAVAPYVDTLLADADGDVRIFTVNLFADLKHPKVLQWLNTVLLHDSAVNVVGAALEVAAEVGNAQTLPALRDAQRRFASDPYIGFCVGLAIERIEAA